MSTKPTAEALGPIDQYEKKVSIDISEGSMVITATVAWGGGYIGWGLRDFTYTVRGASPIEKMAEIVGYAIDMLRASGLDQLITDLNEIYGIGA